MAINQGSIIDHVDKPAIHPNDAVVQTLTPTSNGKVEVTVNGLGVTDYVHAKGLIKAAGNASNYLAFKDGIMSGQSVMVQETGGSTDLIIKNEDGDYVAIVKAGSTEKIEWTFTSTTAGSWLKIGQANRRNIIELDNAAAAVSKTLVAGESGSVILANFSVNTASRGIVVIMPTPAAGLEYAFIIKDAGDGTNDLVIKTATDAVDFKGAWNSVKTGVEGGVIVHSTLTFDISDTATKTHLDGTSFQVISDGSHWYLLGGMMYGGEDAFGTGFEASAGTDVDD
jgi:hypothetical protein